MNTLSSTIRYVTKVLRSCKTEEQLDNSMNWAVAVIATKAKESKKLPIDPRGSSHKHLIPPRVVVCRQCGGVGSHGGLLCEQCEGSGRVVVCSDVETFVTSYKSKDNR